MRRGASQVILGALALPLALASCAGGGDTADAADRAPTTATAPSTADVAGSDDTTAAGLLPAEPDDGVTTTRAPRPSTPPTTRSTTRGTTSTTLEPTTVETLPPVSLPVPVPPPPPRAQEPYVELGTIEIPRIGVTKPLLEGITLNTLDRGPGHWPGTAMPGQLGNAVIAGHRTSHDKPFRDIDQLAVGDEVILTTGDGRFVYEVTGTVVVPPDAMYIIEQTPEFTATLFACHPPGSTRERIVVTLSLVR